MRALIILLLIEIGLAFGLMNWACVKRSNESQNRSGTTKSPDKAAMPSEEIQKTALGHYEIKLSDLPPPFENSGCKRIRRVLSRNRQESDYNYRPGLLQPSLPREVFYNPVGWRRLRMTMSLSPMRRLATSSSSETLTVMEQPTSVLLLPPYSTNLSGWHFGVTICMLGTPIPWFASAIDPGRSEPKAILEDRRSAGQGISRTLDA